MSRKIVYLITGRVFIAELTSRKHRNFAYIKKTVALFAAAHFHILPP